MSFVQQAPNLVVTAGEDGVVALVNVDLESSLLGTTSRATHQISSLLSNIVGVSDLALSRDFMFVANASGAVSVLRLDLW